MACVVPGKLNMNRRRFDAEFPACRATKDISSFRQRKDNQRSSSKCKANTFSVPRRHSYRIFPSALYAAAKCDCASKDHQDCIAQSGFENSRVEFSNVLALNVLASARCRHRQRESAMAVVFEIVSFVVQPGTAVLEIPFQFDRPTLPSFRHFPLSIGNLPQTRRAANFA